MTAPDHDPSMVTTPTFYCDPAVVSMRQLKVSGFVFLISSMGLTSI